MAVSRCSVTKTPALDANPVMRDSFFVSLGPILVTKTIVLYVLFQLVSLEPSLWSPFMRLHRS